MTIPTSFNNPQIVTKKHREFYFHIIADAMIMYKEFNEEIVMKSSAAVV